MRDRARFEEPAQIGGQVGDRRFDQHPAAGLVHLAQALAALRGRCPAAGRRTAGRRRRRIRCWCARTSAAARDQQLALRRGRRGSSRATRAVRASGGRATQMSLENRRNRRASLSVRRVPASPAWALPWFRSADWPRASRRCRPSARPPDIPAGSARAATSELASSFGSESYTTISRSRGKRRRGCDPRPDRARAACTVLCSYGILQAGVDENGCGAAIEPLL